MSLLEHYRRAHGKLTTPVTLLGETVPMSTRRFGGQRPNQEPPFDGPHPKRMLRVMLGNLPPAWQGLTENAYQELLVHRPLELFGGAYTITDVRLGAFMGVPVYLDITVGV